MFRSARIKLTIWYVMISMTISFFFSFGIYFITHRELVRNERRMDFRMQMIREIHPEVKPEYESRHTMIENTERAIAINLFEINMIIVAISSLAGYFLAGRTLRPIHNMVRQQNQFVQDASHELRTPLTSLRTSIEVNLRDKKMHLSQAKSVLSENLEDVVKLQRLSENLLALASFKTNGIDITERVDVTEIVKRACQAVSYQAKAKGILVKTSGEKIYISCDEKRITDALVILLDNAIKYSPKQSIVDVQSKRIEGSVRITVKDQGVGISREDQSRIFERFYRADTSRSKNSTQGYGLGLAIAREVVRAHHGTLQVASTVGKGSTFTISIPLKQKS